MSKLTRVLVVFLACAALGGPSAAASGVIPPIVNIQAPKCVALGGSSLGVPSELLQFQVKVTDLANNPLAGAPVVVDLSGCSDLRLCSDQLDAAAVVDCTQKTVTKFADAAGIVAFRLLGGSVGNLPAGQGSGPLQGTIRVRGLQYFTASISVCAYDLDGSWGVGANDLGVWLTDFGSGLERARSDYDADGSVGANDLSAWLTVFGDGGMTSSCASACP